MNLTDAWTEYDAAHAHYLAAVESLVALRESRDAVTAEFETAEDALSHADLAVDTAQREFERASANLTDGMRKQIAHLRTSGTSIDRDLKELRTLYEQARTTLKECRAEYKRRKSDVSDYETHLRELDKEIATGQEHAEHKCASVARILERALGLVGSELAGVVPGSGLTEGVEKPPQENIQTA